MGPETVISRAAAAAPLPVADSAGKVLDGRLCAAGHHFDPARREHETVQGARGHAAGGELKIGTEAAQIVEIGLDPRDRGGAERPAQSVERRFAIRAHGDDLGEQRIVERRHLGSVRDPRFDACIGGKARPGHEARRGPKIPRRILRIDPSLDRHPARRAGVERQVLAGRLPHHPLDEVDPQHLLGDPVLDLQPRIHFEEEKLPAVGVVDVLDRARRLIRDGLAQADRRLMQAAANVGRQPGRGCLLDDLLMAPLGRTIALAQGDDPARPVAEYLHFDVPGAPDVPFQKCTAAAEVLRRQPLDGGERAAEFRFAVDQLHADAAAARGALQHDRIADAGGFAPRLQRGPEQAAARQQRNAVARRQIPREVLETEASHLRNGRADEHNSGRGALLGELGILAQESIAGMDGRRAGRARRAEQRAPIQVAF